MPISFSRLQRAWWSNCVITLHETPSLAVSLYKEYRGQGIGSQLMVKMLELLKKQGCERTSLAIQKANYAVKMYEDVGFKIVDEDTEEYIMVCKL